MITVTMPSATPITEWLIAMTGTATLKPYWKTGWDKPSSVPAEIAARTSPANAPMKTVANMLVVVFSLKALFATKKYYAGDEYTDYTHV